MKVRKAIIFIGIFYSLIIYSAESTLQNTELTPSLPDLPVEIQKKILNFLIADINGSRFSFLGFCDNNSQAECSALRNFRCIQRILPLNGVCRKLRLTAREVIKEHLAEMTVHVQNRGDPDQILAQISDAELARVAIMAGADINAIKYTAENVIVSEYKGEETLLTQAIKQRNTDKVKTLLSWGADPMVPNAKGEVPLDIAVERASDSSIPALLKENGGDPDSLYHYYYKDYISSIRRYGPRKATTLAKNAKSNPFTEERVPSEHNSFHEDKQDKLHIFPRKQPENAKSYQKGYIAIACIAGVCALMGIKKFLDTRKKKRKKMRKKKSSENDINVDLLLRELRKAGAR